MGGGGYGGGAAPPTGRTFFGVDHMKDIFLVWTTYRTFFGVDHLPDIFLVWTTYRNFFGADHIPDILWVPPDRKGITDRSPRLFVGWGLRPPHTPPPQLPYYGDPIGLLGVGKSEATARVPHRAPGGTAT